MTKLKKHLSGCYCPCNISSITNAQAVKASYSVKASVNAEEPLKVKYLGDDGEYLIFQVVLQSKKPSNASFAIDDKNEGELYSIGLATDYKVQTIKIEKRDDQVLNFKMVEGKKTYSKTFSVNTSLVETTTVAESDLTKL